MEGGVSTIDTGRKYHKTHCSTTIILKRPGGYHKMGEDSVSVSVRNRKGKKKTDHEDETEKSPGSDGVGKNREKEIHGG